MRAEYYIRTIIAIVLAQFIHFILSLFLKFSPKQILTYIAPSPCDPKVHKEWLQKILTKKGEREIEEIKEEAFDAAGFAGTMRRIRVVFKDQTKKAYVMKMNQNNFRNRHAVIANHSYREALFYSHSLSSHVPGPSVVYSYGSYLLGEYTIISEDISQKEDFTKVGPIFGNQIWGVSSPSSRDPVKTMNSIFSTAAEIHSKFWRDESLLSHSWLRCAQWYNNKNRAHWELCIEKGRSCWKKAKESAKKGTLGFEISPKLFAIIEKSFAEASWENNILKMANDKKIPFTLSHGDYHAGNMVLAKDQLFLVDWSQCGVWEPSADLAQILISDVKPELFAKHSKQWVRNYWEKLIELGVPAEEYPFSLLWESFCKSGPQKWIFIFTVMISMEGVPVKLSEYFHNQLLSFIDCHGNYDSYAVQALWCSS